MIAIRTRRALKAFAIVIGCFLGLLGVFALVAPGEHRTTMQAYAHWLWALPLGLGLWALAEIGGTWLASRPFLERMSRPARVFVGICVLVAVAIVFGAVGFVSGARYANASRSVLDREIRAASARDDAALLRMVRDGKSPEMFDYLERSLDSHLIGVVEGGELSRLSTSRRVAIPEAASYRTKYPSSETDAEHKLKLTAAVLQAR